MINVVRKDKLLLKLLLLLSWDKVSASEGKDELLHVHCSSEEEAKSLFESLVAILGGNRDALSQDGKDIEILNGANDFDLLTLEMCVVIAEKLVFLTTFTGWQEFGFEHSKIDSKKSAVRLRMIRDKEGVLSIEMPTATAGLEKMPSAYFYPALEARSGGFEMEVSEQSLEKLGAMLLALVNPRQLSDADIAHSEQISSIYTNMRAVKALRNLFGLEPALKYFSRFSVFRSISRVSYLPKTVYIVESRDPAAAQLAHDFLKKKILIDSGDSAFEKEGKFWFEIEEDEIIGSLETLELIPVMYEQFHAVVNELYRIKGISRMSMRNGQLRIRCDLATFGELSRLAWANIPLGRLKGKAGRAYSNRIYFDTFDLVRQLAELREIVETLAKSKDYSEESIAA